MTASPLHPKVGMMKQRELFGRQADVDQTCAYIGGDANRPVTCGTGVCHWFTNPSYLLCCNPNENGSFDDTCQPATTCLDYSENSLSSTRSYAVVTGYNYLCPSESPICGTVYIYGTDTADTETYSYYVCRTTTVVSSNRYGYVISTGSVSSSVAQSLPEVTSVLVNVTQTVTASPTTDDIMSSSVPPVPTPTQSLNDDDKSPPIGAIVGGVVGGVAALALIAGFIAYRVIKKRKERKPSIPEISRYSDISHAR
ncbi:hypothetical protein KC318_g2544 [Hortaea werneckii]|nr:hypothetical protein KC334_g5316 [Hortaea werneckii]KAI7010711.1 hypothetical protein KC355_g6058 [Hortaea werneckii]KAI7672922.1 hypothetical protein KC318_g2544 [Hortaea werneckii]